jgi:hypothetical protein
MNSSPDPINPLISLALRIAREKSMDKLPRLV